MRRGLDRLADRSVQLRIMILVAMAIDLVDIASRPGPGWSSLTGHGGDLASHLTAFVATAGLLWRRLSLAAGSAALCLLLVVIGRRSTGAELTAILVSTAYVCSVAPRRRAAQFLGLSAGLLAISSWAAGQFSQLADTLGLLLLVTAFALAARGVFVAQARMAADMTRRARGLADARARVRADLALDVNALVRGYLTSTRSALASLPPAGALAADLQRVLGSVEFDARSTLSALRRLLRDLSAAPDGSTMSRGSRHTDPAPVIHQVVARAWSERHRWIVAIVGVGCAVAVVAIGRPLPEALRSAVALAATAVAFWRPRYGGWLLGVALAVANYWVSPAWISILLTFLLATWAGWRGGLRAPALLAVLGLGYLNRAALDPVLLEIIARALVSAVLGGLLGLLIGQHHDLVRAARTLADDLETTRRGLAAAERSTLARELHDNVGHDISLVTLHALEVHGATDPQELREAVTQVASRVESAKTALDDLVAALHDNVDPEESGPELRPAQALAQAAAELRSCGFSVVTAGSGCADPVDGVLARGFARIITETTTNILRHAPQGSTADLRLDCGGGNLTFEATNAVGGRRLGPSSQRGVTGMRERARLLGGQAQCGRQGQHWRVLVTVPLEGPTGDASAPEVAEASHGISG